MIRTLVFDLDGTLLDTAPDILAALEHALAVAGVRGGQPFTRGDIGPPVAEMLERLGDRLTAEQRRRALAAFRAAYDTAPLAATRPFDGATACVRLLRARGVALHVATNKPATPTRLLLQRWFPGEFTDFVSVDSLPDRRLSKDEMLAELTRRHGLEPSASVMVGDAASDLRAGRALGWRTVAALHGYGDAATLRAERPDWSIDSLAELPAILESA